MHIEDRPFVKELYDVSRIDFSTLSKMSRCAIATVDGDELPTADPETTERIERLIRMATPSAF